MKSLVSVGTAILLTLIVTFLVVSNQKAAQFEKERNLLKSGWDAERAELEAALKAAKRPAPVATLAAPPTDSNSDRSSAHETLDKLKKTKVLPGEQRNASIRHIIHLLESLTDQGAESVPAIHEFLAKFEDVEYATELRTEERDFSRDEAKAGASPSGMVQSLPRLDSLLPPSLRLSLVQVLREIGGEPAEQVLAEVLGTSGRGVEVAYVARVLQEMFPNKYRDIAITAAKDLLANPPTIDHPNRLDENARNFLYGVLSMYNDTSFAGVAQGLLVTQDGRVDRTTLTYLNGTLKEDAVPALYQAFKDNRLTNMWERASLATQILSYTGSSQQANDIFREVMKDENLPPWLRATAIQTVAGGRGPLFGGTAPTDPTQIKARIDLLNSLPDVSDERLIRARAEAIQKLSDSLVTEGDAAGSGHSFRTRLGRGQPDPQPQGETPPLPVIK